MCRLRASPTQVCCPKPTTRCRFGRSTYVARAGCRLRVDSDADQCLLLLASLDDGPESWLRTGEALERVWLELTRLGYAASPLNQLVEVAQTHERLRTSLQIDLHPEILLRVGLAPDMVQTPRRPTDEVICSAV